MQYLLGSKALGDTNILLQAEKEENWIFFGITCPILYVTVSIDRSGILSIFCKYVTNHCNALDTWPLLLISSLLHLLNNCLLPLSSFTITLSQLYLRLESLLSWITVLLSDLNNELSRILTLRWSCFIIQLSNSAKMTTDWLVKKLSSNINLHGLLSENRLCRFCNLN